MSYIYICAMCELAYFPYYFMYPIPNVFCNISFSLSHSVCLTLANKIRIPWNALSIHRARIAASTIFIHARVPSFFHFRFERELYGYTYARRSKLYTNRIQAFHFASNKMQTRQNKKKKNTKNSKLKRIKWKRRWRWR